MDQTPMMATTDLRYILEWEDDCNKRVLQQRWTRVVLYDGDLVREDEWREIPLWRLNNGEWEPRT